MAATALLKEEQVLDQVLAQQSIGFGLMSVAGSEKPVDYALYEVSHYNIGIISSDTLEVGTRVTVEYRDGQSIPLVVHQIVSKKNLPPGYKRYRLITTDPEVNFERILPESSYRKVAFTTRHQYHMRFARFNTEIPTRVEARTFGSEEPYHMKTINVSKTGFLLTSPPGFRVPFHQSTLLELTIFLEDQPIRCLGKVIRCEVDFEKKVKRYGIDICDIHAEDREKYFSFIEDTEHRKNRQVFRMLNLPMPI
jgi:hypothetical protein